MITPAVSFSDVAITENLRRWDELAIKSDRGWAAVLTRAVPISVLRELILPVTKLASCSRVHDAEHLADAGFEKIVFTGRGVDSESLGRLKRVSDRTQLVVVIDHFRHAELLSQCMLQSGQEIQVLIEVDIGRQSSGVRPGPDASLLSRATSLLPGLSVIGVFASAHSCRTEAALGDSAADLAAIVTIAEHALQSMRGDSAACREILVSLSSDHRCLMADARINCLIVSPFADFPNDTPRAAHSPSVSLIATVISRPTLEWCVINAGTNALGDLSDVHVHVPAGATIHHSTSETSTLLISGAACDLRIGDLVRLTVGNPERLLNQVQLS